MRLNIIILILVLLLSGADNADSASKRKLKIKSLSVEGNYAFTDRRLYNVIISRPSSFLKRSYYYQDIFNDDLKNLELFYRQNGYLEAQVTDYNVEADSTRNEVHIRINISEGELTQIEGFSVLGNEVVDDNILLQKINFNAGDPFKSKNTRTSCRIERTGSC